jgi:hypothetical protein
VSLPYVCVAIIAALSARCFVQQLGQTGPEAGPCALTLRSLCGMFGYPQLLVSEA